MRLLLVRSAMRPRLLAELHRDDDRALLALLVDYDTSNDAVLALLADDLDEEELAEVARALDFGPDGAA